MSRSGWINLLIVVMVAALAALPLALGSGQGREEPFAGADAQAETAIAENDPHYEPWFIAPYKPPSGEIESALFALQAATGAGFIGYAFGVFRTRRRAAGETGGSAPAAPEATIG